ncbi:similar to Saccharomyces cerevisiae YNR015W SMM1 Dihydrouridine synthase, member of a family of dihydrouridine synthases including Dus1p, Smm1p, Dus3p, and Dus4p [Maudiozyma saulgeensis]|uniref:Similar to Saccharomyces cerevisiae YNR015W SMM1 Dihydrouridine synthase, member of a family of dihydrouridine synthases including Dus1p, Smm1p, Dus3p, and Dus4p n=1 Tax=Maudiozyma saulgeensis TaxID=1789683 RepID=A0A1X7R7I8_9SACH|nr:similar to Saccharomyces cerevisiae YNR015W SMM1 Dihydrouridine synthase, member of a family of dihydrouridine synthases including Dus1p, Smm1p, Dus3p, and Dus4p [Kazachstania saulgeensis]
MSYAGKLVLAPMVRAGELPTRLLALQHGADLVWSPEIVDVKLIQTKRLINEKLNTIDFITTSNNNNNNRDSTNTVVFRTLPSKESGKLIFQIGSNNPDRAVQAALKVVNDVDGIDLNCGCPKHFSIHSGMGAALLSTPDLLCSILKSLVNEVGKPNNKPISCKIRILDNLQNTLTLVEKICSTGITNLTVHCRTREMRNRDAPRWEYLKDIEIICQKAGVSLIMNGKLKDKAHFINTRKALGLPETVGGMIADNAESNPSVFNDSPLSWPLVVNEYYQIAIKMENHFGNTKYMLSRIIPGKQKMYQYVTRCKNYDELNYLLLQMDNITGECKSNDPLKNIESMRLDQKQQQQTDKKRSLESDTDSNSNKKQK